MAKAILELFGIGILVAIAIGYYQRRRGPRK